MHSAFPGLGTVINVATVVAGSVIGMAIGHRFPERTRSVVTDVLGLTTLLVAGLSAASVVDPSLARSVGSGAPVLVVLGSLLIGTITGSLLRIEQRLEGLAGGHPGLGGAGAPVPREASTTPRGSGSSRGG